MSAADERNLRLLREGFDAFSGGNFERALATMHPGVEWHLAFRLPDRPFDRDVYRGPDEVRQLWEAFTAGWETVTIELERVLAARDPWVVAEARFVARGSGSGIELDQPVYYACRVEDEMLRLFHPFPTRVEAFALAGIEDDA